MYMNSAAHRSNYGWRPSIHLQGPLVNPLIERLRNPTSLRSRQHRGRRSRMPYQMPTFLRRSLSMNEQQNWCDSISDYEDANYFNTAVLQDEPSTRGTAGPTTLTSLSRSEPDIYSNQYTGFDFATVEQTFNFGFDLHAGGLNSSVSDTVVTSQPVQRGNLWLPAVPNSPGLSGFPEVVNMRDVHHATPPMSASGSISGLPLVSSCGVEQMGSLLPTAPTSVSLDFSVPYFGSGTEVQTQREPNPANWASVVQWCQDTAATTVSSQGTYRAPNTPASMTPTSSPAVRPQAPDGVLMGSSPVSFTLPPEFLARSTNESMFPVQSTSAPTAQLSRTLPLAPMSVPSAMSISTAKRSREEEESVYSVSGSEDEDFEPEIQGGRHKRIRAQSPHQYSAVRTRKDELLVKGREDGLSYKEIKAKYQFSEAESTLRGRYRTLTKDKEDRVRKPTWTDHDIDLLSQCVNAICRGRDPCEVKISWKQVASYISENGGTYHFGNATCRKKWDELMGIEE